MGNSCIRRSMKPISRNSKPRSVQIAIVGLDNAGKTLTAKVLKGDPHNEVVPTIGFTNVQFKFSKHSVSMYDLGGGLRIRDIWKNYFAEVHGLIFVLDSSHRERIEESREALSSVLDDSKAKGKPLLVLCNKQDVDGAMDCSEICERLQLNVLVTRNQTVCRIECCSARTKLNGKIDKPISDGFRWLLDTIDMNWAQLKDRVDTDVADQKEHQRLDRLERAERVRKLREEREKNAQGEGKLGDYDEKDEINGDPFKPLDMRRLSTKVNAERVLQSSLPTANGKSDKELPSNQSDGPFLSVGNQGSEICLKDNSAEDRAGYPQSNSSSCRDENDVNNEELSALVNEDTREIIQSVLTRAPITVPGMLPPLEVVVMGNGKRKKQRKNRNRIFPLGVDELRVESSPSEQQIHSGQEQSVVSSTDDRSISTENKDNTGDNLDSSNNRSSTEVASAISNTKNEILQPNGDCEDVVL